MLGCSAHADDGVEVATEAVQSMSQGIESLDDLYVEQFTLGSNLELSETHFQSEGLLVC